MKNTKSMNNLDDTLQGIILLAGLIIIAYSGAIIGLILRP